MGEDIELLKSKSWSLLKSVSWSLPIRDHPYRLEKEWLIELRLGVLRLLRFDCECASVFVEGLLKNVRA